MDWYTNTVGAMRLLNLDAAIEEYIISPRDQQAVDKLMAAIKEKNFIIDYQAGAEIAARGMGCTSLYSDEETLAHLKTADIVEVVVGHSHIVHTSQAGVRVICTTPLVPGHQPCILGADKLDIPPRTRFMEAILWTKSMEVYLNRAHDEQALLTACLAILQAQLQQVSSKQKTPALMEDIITECLIAFLLYSRVARDKFHAPADFALKQARDGLQRREALVLLAFDVDLRAGFSAILQHFVDDPWTQAINDIILAADPRSEIEAYLASLAPVGESAAALVCQQREASGLHADAEGGAAKEAGEAPTADPAQLDLKH